MAIYAADQAEVDGAIQPASKIVDLITPQTRHRKVKFQDGRKLRRYKRRWIVERTNSWLNTG